ncbi:hypothetical protein QBC47DRAFT_185774 [Echria macrotheca]|uniref:Rhodopsin domain-containing protein n=1 Tax=Echria macrotheca TaxID=438768 RepID=A0AAJ0BDQ9_9PEZI|nr:hypothetical protein QBC47DRAFT_185774 [Echria macrotheca]
MSATTKAPPSDPALAGESNVPRILGLGITFHALALVFFGLRMYTRMFVVKSVGKDDVMMVLCMIGLTGGGMVTVAVAIAHGLGHHAFTLSDHDLIVYGITVFIQAMLTTVTSLCFLKLSVAFSLLRLSGPMNIWWTRVIWALIIFICLYMVESWISILAFCDPIAAQWDKALLKTARCWPTSVFRVFPLFNTGCNIFTDICFATLPVPMIWRLQMKLRTRVYLVGVFSLGYAAVFIGIAKAVSQVKYRGDPDAVFHNWTQTLGFLQQNVGVIAACAPALKPLVGHWLKLSSTSREYYGSSQRGQTSGSKRSRGMLSNRSHKLEHKSVDDGGEGGYEMGPSPRHGFPYTHRTTVRSGKSPGSSEERIIGFHGDIKDGVLKTTEVFVS